MYYMLKEPITLKFADNREASKELRLSKKPKENIYYIGKEVPTGLSAPYPEVAFELRYTGFNYTPTLLITQEQLDKCFQLLVRVKKGDRVLVKEDTTGRDNCWNQPARLEVPKGTVLIAEEPQATSRGDYFFKFGNNKIGLNDLYVPAPYAMPLVISDRVEIMGGE